MKFERKEYWERFHVFLGINSGLLAFVGVLLGFTGDVKVSTLSQLEMFFLSLSSIGFTFNLAWLFANFRSHAYYKYWFKHAKNLEKDERLKMLSTGTELERYFSRMPKWCFYKTLPITVGSQIVPGCFAFIFTIIYLALFEQWYVAVAIDIVVFSVFVVFGMWKVASIYGGS
jgi:hypothetical protein